MAGGRPQDHGEGHVVDHAGIGGEFLRGQGAEQACAHDALGVAVGFVGFRGKTQGGELDHAGDLSEQDPRHAHCGFFVQGLGGRVATAKELHETVGTAGNDLGDFAGDGAKATVGRLDEGQQVVAHVLVGGVPS